MTAQSLTTALNDTMTSNQNITVDPCGQFKLPANGFFTVSYLVVCLASLALNIITMWVYYCTSLRFRSSVTVYLKNLAAADFFLCLVLPLRIANFASKSTTMRRIYCSFGAAGFYLNMYASIIFMNCIAANRYLKIAHPFETRTLQTAGSARWISIITWTILSAMALIYVVVFLNTSSEVLPSPQTISCVSLHSTQVNIVYKIIHSISALIFIFVLVSLILFYWGTMRKLQNARRPVQTRRYHHKLNTSKRNMLVIMVVFCVCFVPYHLVRLPYAFLNIQLQECTAKLLYFIKEFTVLLSVLNACMDPLIYFVFCKGFRKHMGIKKFKVSSNLKLNIVQRDRRKQSNTDTDDSSTKVRCELVTSLQDTQLGQTELQHEVA